MGGWRDYEDPGSMVAKLNQAVVAADIAALETLLRDGADPSSQIEEVGRRRYSTDEMDTPLQSAIEMKGWGKHGSDVNIVKILLEAHKTIEKPALNRKDWLVGTNAGWVRRESYSRTPPFAHCLQHGLVSEAKLILEEIRVAIRPNKDDPRGDGAKDFKEGLTKQGNDLVMNVVTGTAQRGRDACLALLELTIGIIQEFTSSDMKVIMGIADASGTVSAHNYLKVTPLYALACGLADVAVAEVLLRHGGREILSKATQPDPRAELFKETGIGFAGTGTNTTYAKWSEDNAWTPLIAACWYGRPEFVKFLLKELGVTAARHKTYIHGLGPRDFVEHRIKQFEVLVEYEKGSKSGEKPENYEESHPRGTVTVTHQFRGEDFRHGFRDTRTDQQMLADLNNVACELKAFDSKSCVVL